MNLGRYYVTTFRALSPEFSLMSYQERKRKLRVGGGIDLKNLEWGEGLPEKKNSQERWGQS